MNPQGRNLSCTTAEYTDDQREFLMAVDEFKRSNDLPFPKWTEVLDVVLSLGYRKVAPKSPSPLYKRHHLAVPRAHVRED